MTEIATSEALATPAALLAFAAALLVFVVRPRRWVAWLAVSAWADAVVQIRGGGRASSHRHPP